MTKHRRTRFAPLRHPEYRRLWLASTISDLGDAVGRIALTILIQRDTGSALYTGAVIAVFAVPFLGPGQWLTGRLSHVDRRRLLVTADLLRAAVFLGIALPIGVWPRLLLLLVAGTATPAFEGTVGALVPRSVPAGMVPLAVGLRTASTEAAFVVGFALGGLLADSTSPTAVIAFNAGTFVVSAFLLRGISVGAAPAAETGAGRLSLATRTLWADAPTRAVLLLTGLTFATALVPETLVATYADETFPATTGLAGTLASLVAVGVILASLLHRPAGHHELVRHAATMATVGGFVMFLAFAAPDRIPAAVFAYVAVGPVLAIRVHAFTLIAERTPDAQMAAAMSIGSGVLMAAHVVAGLGGGAVAEAIGIDQASTIAGAATAVIGAIAWLGHRGREPVSSAA